MGQTRAQWRLIGEGTYVAFIDFRLAYPSTTDHSVIFTKIQWVYSGRLIVVSARTSKRNHHLLNKGITGRLWLAVWHLYQKPLSRVMHPDIAQTDFFDLPHGIREGSILGPVLFVIAVDDMAEELRWYPFTPRPAQTRRGGFRPDPATEHQGFGYSRYGWHCSNTSMMLLCSLPHPRSSST